jgi:hypothetical protein
MPLGINPFVRILRRVPEQPLGTSLKAVRDTGISPPMLSCHVFPSEHLVASLRHSSEVSPVYAELLLSVGTALYGSHPHSRAFHADRGVSTVERTLLRIRTKQPRADSNRLPMATLLESAHRTMRCPWLKNWASYHLDDSRERGRCRTFIPNGVPDTNGQMGLEPTSTPTLRSPNTLEIHRSAFHRRASFNRVQSSVASQGVEPRFTSITLEGWPPGHFSSMPCDEGPTTGGPARSTSKTSE